MNSAPLWNVITAADAEYPKLLNEMVNPPKQLYIRGTFAAPEAPHIAVVGTRKISPLGKEFARKIARELAERGCVIVSGLALGADTEAHRGALEAGGVTVAVLGIGIDSIYPASNESLARDIVEHGGAIVSEYGPGEPALKFRFLERNRIVSGMCDATVVIEAPERSGSLATAQFAAEQGRDVFVLPGNANNPNYAGSHALIRDGARLITSARDIIADLGIEPAPQKIATQGAFPLSSLEQRVCRALESAGTPLPLETLVCVTKTDPSELLQTLTMLTLSGHIIETDRGYMQCI